jgi:hypothetical protein
MNGKINLVPAHPWRRYVREIHLLVEHLVFVAQPGAEKPLGERLQGNDVFAMGNTIFASATRSWSFIASRMTGKASAPTLPCGAMQ